MTKEENSELIKEMLGFITMKCNVMNAGNYEILASMIKDDVDRIISKLHQPTVIVCLHPFNEVVSGDDGDFCCKCQTYLKSNRL